VPVACPAIDEVKGITRVASRCRTKVPAATSRSISQAHEASVSKVSEAQLFYLMSRGLNEAQASALIVNGFLEPFVKELPMEYAVELNRLVQLQMEGSVG